MLIIIDCELSLLSYSARADKLSTVDQIEIKDEYTLERIEKLSKMSRNPVHIITACPQIQLITDYLAQYILSQKSFTVHYAPPLNPHMVSEVNAKWNAETDFKIFVGKFPSQPGYWFVYNHTLEPSEKNWRYQALVLDKRLSLMRFFERHQKSLDAKQTPKNPPFYSKDGSQDPNHFKRVKHLKKEIPSDTHQTENKKSRSPVRDLLENEITSSTARFTSPSRRILYS